MSATNRGGDRIPLDQYYTHPTVARACVHALLLTVPLPLRLASWVEPSVGGGAFVDPLREKGATGPITGADLNPDAPGLARCSRGVVGDFLTLGRDELGTPDVILGNPPFARGTGRTSPTTGREIMEPIAEQHVRHALSIVRPGGIVAFLLRLAFAESVDRVAFWDEHHARAVFALAERPSFTGGGTDNCAYGWFIFERGYVGPTDFVPGWSWHRLAEGNGWALPARRAA
jgi:hypothetical protein